MAVGADLRAAFVASSCLRGAFPPVPVQHLRAVDFVRAILSAVDVVLWFMLSVFHFMVVRPTEYERPVCYVSSRYLSFIFLSNFGFRVKIYRMSVLEAERRREKRDQRNATTTSSPWHATTSSTPP